MLIVVIVVSEADQFWTAERLMTMGRLFEPRNKSANRISGFDIVSIYAPATEVFARHSGQVPQ